MKLLSILVGVVCLAVTPRASLGQNMPAPDRLAYEDAVHHKNAVSRIKGLQSFLDSTLKASAASLEPHRFDVSYLGADLEKLATLKPSSWTCTRAEGAISCSLDEPIGEQ
jgi:hypothetical protein